jgi:hypothetical protein
MTDLLLARDAAVLLLSNCNERLGRVFAFAVVVAVVAVVVVEVCSATIFFECIGRSSSSSVLELILRNAGLLDLILLEDARNNPLDLRDRGGISPFVVVIVMLSASATTDGLMTVLELSLT